MAESLVNETVANLSTAVNETAKNATGRVPATPEGMLVAYASLVLMALLPIFFGSFRSVKYLTEQKVGWQLIFMASFSLVLIRLRVASGFKGVRYKGCGICFGVETRSFL